ncbi:MAG: FUSC family protein [Gammaproteobacteria bacterium]
MTNTLRIALLSITAVLASFGTMYAICVGLSVNASPAVLAAALAVGLMRRPERLEARAVLIKFVKLPIIAVAAGLVGLALLDIPALGAVLFTGGIALSVQLRKYGARASAIGQVIALSLISILVVPPVHIESTQNPWLPPLLMISAGLIALTSTVLVSWLSIRIGLASEPAEPPRIVRAPRAREGQAQLHVATRMALQMLVAVGLAFVIGMLGFPEHWPWIVLTAFIVCSGALGRGDAVYKGLLRLSGAIGGAFVAAVVSYIVFPNPEVYAAAVFFVLFIGIWLRQINYAYWAACATLLFALLQDSHGTGIAWLLAIRVLCIVIGALCGVAAIWFVYPIRTEQVARKRVADALASLRDVLGNGPGSPEYQSSLAALDHHAAELERVAPSVNLHWRVFGAVQPDQHPATWIKLMHTLLAQVRKADCDRAHVGAEMRRLGAMLRTQATASRDTGDSS